MGFGGNRLPDVAPIAKRNLGAPPGTPALVLGLTKKIGKSFENLVI
jgi:hypothetical protein